MPKLIDKVRSDLRSGPMHSWALLVFAFVWAAFVAIGFALPNENYQDGQSSLAPVVGFVAWMALVATGIFLLGWCAGIAQREVWPWVGFTAPHGTRIWRWLWLPGALIVGYLIRVAVVDHLDLIWPSLSDLTSAQRAANDAREVWSGTSPTWMNWFHAAGEEIGVRAVVVAATVYAFADRPLHWRGAARYRLGLLAVVVVATSTWFAFGHLEYGTYNFVAMWFLGPACAAVAILTRSIWPAAALHAAYNTPDLAAALTHLW